MCERPNSKETIKGPFVKCRRLQHDLAEVNADLNLVRVGLSVILREVFVQVIQLRQLLVVIHQEKTVHTPCRDMDGKLIDEYLFFQIICEHA